MPYFFIAPAFVLVTLVTLAAIGAAWFRPAWRTYVPVLSWGYAGAAVGFLLANLAVNAVALLLIMVSDGLEGSILATPSAVGGGVLLIIGPFPASAGGFAVGAFLGARRALRSGRRRVAEPGLEGPGVDGAPPLE